jgi:hypothetical protein
VTASMGDALLQVSCGEPAEQRAHRDPNPITVDIHVLERLVLRQ